MPQLNTAEAVAAALVANGIDTLYCVPGVQNDVLMDAFYHVQDKVRIVHTRHEQGAAYMALGAAMATGKPQVYAVVPGPGFLNSTAALVHRLCLQRAGAGAGRANPAAARSAAASACCTKSPTSSASCAR